METQFPLSVRKTVFIGALGLVEPITCYIS